MSRKLFGIGFLLTAALVAPTGVARAQLQFDVVHSFPATGPSHPRILFRATDGNFYGIGRSSTNDKIRTTSQIFRMTPEGVVTVLRIFPGGDEGEARTLIQGADGSLYGTTYNGTISRLFKMTLDGVLTIVTSTPIERSIEQLMQAADGNFYASAGSAHNNCTNGFAIIYKISPAGEVSSLTTHVRHAERPHSGS